MKHDLIESTKLTPQEIAEYFGLELYKWHDRWPRYNLWHCQTKKCWKIILRPGHCSDHLDPNESCSPLALGNSKGFLFLVNDHFYALKDIIGTSSSKYQNYSENITFRFKDDNQYNCHLTNLLACKSPRTQYTPIRPKMF